ncbi:uncharacterized protein LOC116257178 [Nymphaea colorata]|nr:uncharacterized protein LOC116257178 [Nymphaea colorata]
MVLPLVLLLLFSSSLGHAGTPPYEIPSSCNENQECPPYRVVAYDKGNAFEIRQYESPVWVSSVPVNGSFSVASIIGFASLYSFFGGNNDADMSIPLTGPTVTKVSSSSTGTPTCTVYFYVPKKIQENPPSSQETQVVRWPAGHHAAVRRFSGVAGDVNVPLEVEKLKQSLQGSPWQGNTTSPDYHVASFVNPLLQGDDSINEIMFIFDQ